MDGRVSSSVHQIGNNLPDEEEADTQPCIALDSPKKERVALSQRKKVL
jgi:hypothetical protein